MTTVTSEIGRDLRMPRWVIVWLIVTACIQTYDALYELLGHLSHAGGPLAWLWPGHVFYAKYDQRYAGIDAFGSAQSWANLLEVVVLLCVLVWLRTRFSGLVLALIVSTATFWKTVLYFLVEICSGLAMTKQSLQDGNLGGFLAVAVLPNLVWIVVPLLVIIVLGRQAARVGRRLAGR